MKATEAKLLDFIKKSPQFVIPIYQRSYSWTERECRQLWDDIMRTGNDDKILAHFVGSIVYIEKGLYQVSSQSPLLVIDGQQRLTTVTLLLAALVNAIEKFPESNREPVDGFSPRKIKNYYLLNPEEKDEREYKLLLSQTDKTSLIAIVSGKEQPKDSSLRIFKNFSLFRDLIEGSKDKLEVICKGLAKLVVVDIALNRDQDNPQLIFESMNSTGRELSQADLIRNFILMGLEPKQQTQLYEEFWRPMELDFGQEAYGTHFDGFMRHFLTVKTGEISNVDEVYEAFKVYARSNNVEVLVKDIREFSKYFCAMALGEEKDDELNLAFHDLQELKVDVAYPFLLFLYNDYTMGKLQKSDFITIVRLIESYVFRRAVSNLPTNSMNKTFSTFSKFIKQDCYVESIKAHFLLLPIYRRFPNDDEFKREIQIRDLYNFRSKLYWLRRFENFNRKEYVLVNEYTIEHILPQNVDLSKAWKTALGYEWEKIQQTWLHTLGNLTLTGYNSEYSDKPFSEKRDMKGGFKDSPLKLNEGLGKLEKWNEDTIKQRGQRIAEKAIQVWISPSLPIEILSKYEEKKDTRAVYSIKDHQHLESKFIRDLFETFRKEVFAIDKCVVEEFLKKYIAYKAESSFVSVKAQAKRLKLILNISQNEIVDPKGLCRDVSQIGHHGVGQLEVGLSDVSEIPYIMSLVRQAFERQIANGN